ncbi:MAG TPA: hypothetical protein VJ723_06945 [Candidatus Angelobacter sp.]|nr:hypothetical protein [Candidatus Angelobacter sp.]
MRKLLFAIPLLMICCSFSPAQSVNKIISRYIKATGGAHRQKAVKTIRVTQRIDTGDPADNFDFTVMKKRGNKFRMEQPASLPVAEMKESEPSTPLPAREKGEISGCDGHTSWVKYWGNPAKIGFANCDGAADLDSPLMDYKKKGFSIVLVGKETIEGQDLYHLVVTGTKTAPSVHFYLDAQTFLLARIITENHGQHQEDVYSDYRQVDGITVAFCDEMRFWTVQDDPQQEDRVASPKVGDESRQKQIIKKIEFNIPLDDSLFAIPADAVNPAKRTIP